MPEPVYKIRSMDKAVSVIETDQGKFENKSSHSKQKNFKKPAKVHGASVDRAVENKVEEEYKLSQHENLLDDDAPQEF